MNLNKKNILVTGGTGSFGNKFIKTILKTFKPNKVVIFSRDEQKQYEMAQSLPETEYKNIRYFIGDVRDKPRLDRACANIDIIIHLFLKTQQIKLKNKTIAIAYTPYKSCTCYTFQICTICT